LRQSRGEPHGLGGEAQPLPDDQRAAVDRLAVSEIVACLDQQAHRLAIGLAEEFRGMYGLGHAALLTPDAPSIAQRRARVTRGGPLERQKNHNYLSNVGRHSRVRSRQPRSGPTGGSRRVSHVALKEDMVMDGLDFSPLFRSTIGFDRLMRLADAATRV